MLSELLKNKNLFYQLFLIDKEIAEQYRQMKCPYCGGTLHYANYYRKPRGEPEDINEECFIRFSLCCSQEGCRRRIIPHSCRFLGRKVYWFVNILIVVYECQNSEDCIFRLSKLYDISRYTLKRWLLFFKNVFPVSSQWQKIRGLVKASIKNSELPSILVKFFLNIKTSAQDAVVSCLKFLSQGFSLHIKIRDG